MYEVGTYVHYVLPHGPPILAKVVDTRYFTCEVELPAGRSCGEDYPMSRTWVHYDRVRPVSPLRLLAKAAEEQP